MARSPYDVLGVPKTATDDEVKKAYRKLARENHPDANQGDAAAEERFKEIQGAYDTALRPGEAQAVRHVRRQRRRGGGPGGPGPGGFTYENVDLSDLLGQFGGIFGRGGGRRARPQPERGADLESRVRLSFEDALAGAQVRVPVEIDAPCHTCHGTGAEPGTSPITCPQCGGSGTVSDSHGLFALSQPCPRCRGNGVIVEKPCQTCRGTGPRAGDAALRRQDPGRGEGRHARAAEGQGRAGRERRPRRRPLRRRRPSTRRRSTSAATPTSCSTCRSPIPRRRSARRSRSRRPKGPVNLKVPAGTESGKLLRVKGRGAPKLKGGGKGDLLARVKVTVPQKLTKAEKEALEGFDKVLRERPRDRAFKQ